MDLISAAAEQNRDEALARAMHDTKSMPFIPKKEVNASHEADLKKFDTRGMKKLTKEDQEKYHKWEWCDTGLVEAEVAKYLYADLWAGAGDAGEAKDGEKGGGGCCEIL